MTARMDHVGVVVDDFPAANRLLTDVLPFTFQRSLAIPGRLDAAFYKCGDASLELIDINDPGERERRLGTSRARIEHIAVQVDDLNRMFDRLRAAGVQLATSHPVVNGPIRSYVTRPETSSGIIFQVFEWVDGAPRP